MTKEIIEKLIGKDFWFLSANFGLNSVKGTVLTIEDNWIEIQTKKEIRFINADFLSEIRKI